MTDWLLAQTQVSSANPLVLFAAAATWAGIWINVALHFYFKGEKLHQDYHSSGKLDAKRSQIEAKQLIPALGKMFDRAFDAHAGKKSRPNMEQLLQAVEFLPDFQAAQSAMGSIEELQWNYDNLRSRATRLWKWQFAHSINSLALIAVYVFCYPMYSWSLWLLALILGAWLMTLGASLAGIFKFHSLMSSFNTCLES